LGSRRRRRCRRVGRPRWPGQRFRGADERYRGAGAGGFGSTEGRYHKGVIPVLPLALTTARSIAGHVGDARVIKVGSRDCACAGLAMSAGFRRCGRCHALTFHCSNGLLNPWDPPRSSEGLGPTGVSGSRLARGVYPFTRRLYRA
jgi:hypothetical protein